MPLPKPRDNESQEDFMERCLSSDTMNEEYPDNDQRYAICMTQWRDRNKTEDNMERKSFTGIELKADKPGSFVARIATLNVIDKDGDVTIPGAFPDGKTILISAYMHGSWMGELPVGKGVIHEQGDEVLVEGEFNLNSDTGKEHYETIKFAPDLQEWSYGFIATEFESDAEWQGNHVSRILKKVDVFEASPVLRGAGMDTATLTIKQEGVPYAEQAESALAAVNNLLERTKSLADIRRKEGRDLSKANKDRMKDLTKTLNDIQANLTEFMAEPESHEEEIQKAIAEFLKIDNRIKEVSDV